MTAKWAGKTCCICGTGSAVYIEISIALPVDSEHPYSQTALCQECWLKRGIGPAFDHNESLREQLEPGA